MVKLSDCKTVDQVIDERVADDPEFAGEWERTRSEREREIEALRAEVADAETYHPPS